MCINVDESFFFQNEYKKIKMHGEGRLKLNAMTSEVPNNTVVENSTISELFFYVFLD